MTAALRIQPLRVDIDAALRLSTIAGWNQISADWARLIALWPEFCLGGWIDNHLIATATLAVYPGGLGWIGMILVDPAHQKRGHGGAMLDAIIARGISAGISILGLDATDEGRPVYLKRGFVDEMAIDRWIGHAGKTNYSESRPFTAEDWPSLQALDYRATGLDRAPLLRHLAGEAGASLRVIRDGNRVTAYGFSRPGRISHFIGPIVAETDEQAAYVVYELLSEMNEERAVAIDLPRGSLGDYVSVMNFTVARRLIRMRKSLGAAIIASGDMVRAACGFELG